MEYYLSTVIGPIHPSDLRHRDKITATMRRIKPSVFLLYSSLLLSSFAYLRVPTDFCGNGNPRSNKPNAFYCSGGYSVHCVDGVAISQLLCPRGCDWNNEGCNPVGYCELVTYLSSTAYCSPYVNYPIDYQTDISYLEQRSILLSNLSDLNPLCGSIIGRAVCNSLYNDCTDRKLSQCKQSLKIAVEDCRWNESVTLCIWSLGSLTRFSSVEIIALLLVLALI